MHLGSVGAIVATGFMILSGCDAGSTGTGGDGGAGGGGSGGGVAGAGGGSGGGNGSPSCHDGITNQDETDIDCGGDLCEACALGADCRDDDDCEAALTCGVGATCVEPCADGRQDRDETDVDCGGDWCGPCGLGASCIEQDDCADTLACGVEDRCAEPCADGRRNQDETDIDCGGDSCVPCGVGASCVEHDDCAGVYKCDNLLCADTCADGDQNYDETDRDCGGSICPLCLSGQSCTSDHDCDLGLTCPVDSCVDPCADGVLGGVETAVDCGGLVCPACGTGEICIEDTDCFSGWCDAGHCAVPATAMTAEELCRLYRHYDEHGGDLCLAAHAPSAPAQELEAPASTCRLGSGAYTWAVHLLEAEAAGRVVIDWFMAHECLAESRALRAASSGYLLLDETPGTPGADWAALRAGICYDFYAGAVPAGGACKDDWDCVEGLFCASTAPWTPGGAQCLPPASTGEGCTAWMGCGNDSFCQGEVCRAKGDAGAPCDRQLAGEDCLAGDCAPSDELCSFLGDPIACTAANGCRWQAAAAGGYGCDAEDYACAATTALRAIGEACAADTDCAGTCVRCRPFVSGDDPTCERPSGPGEYCRDDYDCLPDLTCIGDTCGKLGRGRPCTDVFQTGGQCRTGYTCVPPADNCAEGTGEEEACLARAGCRYEVTSGWCIPETGECHPLPQSGPCVYGYCAPGTWCDESPSVDGECVFYPTTGECALGRYCAVGYYCDDGDQPPACLPQATGGQPCDGGLPHSCGVGFTCVASVCVVSCADHSDCAAGEICNRDFHRCEPAPAQCALPEQCAADEFCRDAVSACARFQTDIASCVTDDRCAVAQDICLPTAVRCGDFDGNPSGCLGTGGCLYGACYEVECGDLSGAEIACTATSKCVFDTGACYEVDCLEFDGNAAGCGATGICTYNSDNNWCDPIASPDCDAHLGDPTACTADPDCVAGEACLADPGFDCSIHDGAPAACDATTGCERIDVCEATAWTCAGLAETPCLDHDGCRWNETTGICERLMGECTLRYGAGELCAGDVDCASDYCSLDTQTGDGSRRCEVRLSRGCNHDPVSLRGVFLFGLVFAVGRRGRPRLRTWR